MVNSMSHADRLATLRVARCRGVRRIVRCLNMLLRVQATDEHNLATVQHGSLLRAKFQFVRVDQNMFQKYMQSNIQINLLLKSGETFTE